MKQVNEKYLSLLLTMVFIVGFVVFADAQCPMCKIAAESNLENGGTEGKGLNKGILYMLMLPYILVSTIGFLWWKHNRKAKDDERYKEEAISDLLK